AFGLIADIILIRLQSASFREASPCDEQFRCDCAGYKLGPRRPASAGKVNRKIVPWGRPGVAHNLPPWDSIIERQIERPIPMPSTLVVKNELKIRSISF